MMPRKFQSEQFFQISEHEPIRSVVTQSEQAVVIAWHLEPRQQIEAHLHPNGQDTWTILQGRGQYYLDTHGTIETITAGDVVVAHVGQVHGVLNDGELPLRFISVVSPAEAGYQLLEKPE
jgi:quercetin dioxygenase-like cupin family protein